MTGVAGSDREGNFLKGHDPCKVKPLLKNLGLISKFEIGGQVSIFDN